MRYFIDCFFCFARGWNCIFWWLAVAKFYRMSIYATRCENRTSVVPIFRNYMLSREDNVFDKVAKIYQCRYYYLWLALSQLRTSLFPRHNLQYRIKANCRAYRSASSHAYSLQMPDDGSQLRKVMTSVTQSCTCVYGTPSFRDGRRRPLTHLDRSSV